MAVKLTKEFWINVVLFVVACVALGLSIWAFATPCKKDGFGDQPGMFGACCPDIEKNRQNCIDKGPFGVHPSDKDMTCPSNLKCKDYNDPFGGWPYACQ